MATAPASYPLDLDGNSPANLVRGELQVLVEQNDTPYRFFIPKFAPFYLTNLEIKGKDQDGVVITLKDGIDYFPCLQFLAATWSTGSLVFAAITIINQRLQGPFNMTYQTLGGKYAADRNFVVERIAEHNYNPRSISWDQLTNIQEQFPPSQHPQNIDTFTGFRDLLDATYSIRDAIPQQPGPNNVIWKHILDLNDPHQTLRLIPAISGFATKEDVANAILNHVAQTNPHNQYLLKSDYTPGGGGSDLDCDACIAKHVAQADPHPQYLTKTAATAQYAAKTDLADYLKKTEATNLYLTKTDAAATYATKTDLSQYLPTTTAESDYIKKTYLEANYWNKTDSDARYMTQAKTDARYYSKTESDNLFAKKTDIANFITQAQGDVRYLSKTEAEALYGANGTNTYRPPQATTTVVGITRYGTQAEHTAATSTSVAVVPAYMKVAVDGWIDTKIAAAGNTGDTSGCCDPGFRLFFNAR